MTFPSQNFRIFLFMILLIVTLCVNCRSSRTGVFKKNQEVYTNNSEIEFSDIDRYSRINHMSIKSDTLRISIVEYYIPANDTSIRGPVKSEKQIWYKAVSTSDSSSVEKEVIIEKAEKKENEVSVLHEEKINKVSPWFMNWKLYLALIVFVVLYLLFRKIKII